MNEIIDIHDQDRDECGLADQFTEKMTTMGIKHVLDQLPTGPSLSECEECGNDIPMGRQKAYPGVKTCVDCQAVIELNEKRTIKR